MRDDLIHTNEVVKLRQKFKDNCGLNRTLLQSGRRGRQRRRCCRRLRRSLRRRGGWHQRRQCRHLADVRIVGANDAGASLRVARLVLDDWTLTERRVHLIHHGGVQSVAKSY